MQSFASLSKFYLTFFLFDTAVTLIMHCNKHIKSDDGLFKSLGYPQLARRLRSRKPQHEQCNLRSDVVILYFPSSPCSRKRLIEVKRVYDHSQKPCKVYQQ